MNINITVFASLKEYFEPSFSLELPEGAQVEYVLERLSLMQEAASGILEKCRVAVDSVIVGEDKILKNGENIYILPPSSGG